MSELALERKWKGIEEAQKPLLLRGSEGGKYNLCW